MSKIPYRKKRKVNKAKRQFDRKLKRDKAANRFYAEEVSREGEILEEHLTKKEEIKDQIVLEVLEHEKKKDELHQFAQQKIAEQTQETISRDEAIIIASEKKALTPEDVLQLAARDKSKSGEDDK